MEFDKSKVYSAVNADELKIGSKIIVADCFENLKQSVLNNEIPRTLLKITGEDTLYRFKTSDCKCALAYLVSEPAKLHWRDLEIGDIITNGSKRSMVITIDSSGDDYHIYTTEWLSDTKLKDWVKVEK